jgi:LmbE family N-acetylglucosaminyl deacetylase
MKEDLQKNNFIIIAPHQDDEVLGCGGKAIKLIQKEDFSGHTIFIYSGWSGISVKSRDIAIKERENEAKEACRILGINDVRFLRQDDRTFVLDKSVLQKIVKIIRQINPQIIMAPHKNESDFEHQTAYNLTKEAIWLSKSNYMPDLGDPANNLEKFYLYEIWTPMQKFLVKEDISEQINQKRKAMKEYCSQNNNSKIYDAIEGLNLYRGSITDSKKKYAEVFDIERT